MQKYVQPSDPLDFAQQEWLTPKEAASYLRVSKSYLDKLRVYGGGPRFFRPGKRKVLYRKTDLDAWAAKLSFDSTSDYEQRVPSDQ